MMEIDEKTANEAKSMIADAMSKRDSSVDDDDAKQLLAFAIDAALAIAETEKHIGRKLSDEERTIASVVALHMGMNTIQTMNNELEKMLHESD